MFEILLIDDEAHITASIKKTIPWHEIEVHQVYEAHSAEQAIELLETQTIDIVITDIHMPGMNGLQLVELLRSRWPHIRCIFVTGYADFQYAQKALKLQAFDYLLKPVKDEDMIRSISNAIDVLKDEWNENEKKNKLSYNFKSNYNVLITNLFHDLLLGRTMTSASVEEKLRQYEVALRTDEETIILLFQLSNVSYDIKSLELIEYAVGNIAQEIFHDDFYVLHSKTPHHCSMLVIQAKQDGSNVVYMSSKQRTEVFKERITSFQKSVSNYLKMNISMVVSGWFLFPDDLSQAYRSILSSYYLLNSQHTMEITYIDSSHSSVEQKIYSLDSLYRPPTLINLLESKQWQTARRKLEDIFQELRAACSIETLYEVYFSVTNTFLYVAHKQGQRLSKIDQLNVDLLMDRGMLNSVDKLKEWTISTLNALEETMAENDQYTKGYIVSKVQALLSTNLGADVSVKSIADSVNLHPVYLSKIYKLETGEGLSDYIIRMKMERALYLLKNSNKKIYEITEELGYQNSQSFRKMFKKHFNMSPNEFRET